MGAEHLEGRIRQELPDLAEVEVRQLARILERLIEGYQPERIYLFGSKARGDAGPDSDYDLMVVVPDDAPAERRRSRLAYERLWGTGTAADVLVWTRGTFDRRVHLQASLWVAPDQATASWSSSLCLLRSGRGATFPAIRRPSSRPEFPTPAYRSAA